MHEVSKEINITFWIYERYDVLMGCRGLEMLTESELTTLLSYQNNIRRLIIKGLKLIRETKNENTLQND